MKHSGYKLLLILIFVLPLNNFAQASESEDLSWRFAAGLSLHTGSTLKFHDVNRAGLAGDAGADIDLRNAFSVDLDLRHVTEDSWGVIAGLSFDTEREITGGAFTGSAWGIPYNGSGDHIRVSVLSGSAVYRWTYFYIPFGLNISRVQYEKNSGSPGSYDERGGIGSQIGIGWYIHDNAVVEFMARSVSVNLEYNDGVTVTDYRRGYLSSLTLGAKYLF